VSLRLGTSLRARPAAHTAAAGKRLMQQLGISRVIDITALDRLGLPVFVSLRPGGRAARLHAGKGVSAQDAYVGALMEAVECAVAEQAAALGPYAGLPLGQLAGRLPSGLSLRDFSPRLDATLQADRTTAAVRCVDLLGRQRPLLPAELVMVPSPEEQLPPLFGWSSNGLAIGNTLPEATLHALLEVLERDTITMTMARANARFVDPQTLPEPFAARARHWQALGVQLFVRHLPGDFELPCFEATLHEPGSTQVELARGWGMHFDRGVALARAVCEAAQARLCKIHSQHADMTALYGTRVGADPVGSARAKDQFLASLAEDASPIDFQELPHREHRSIGSALKDLLGRLESRGFRHVFRHRMAHDATTQQGLHVVKLIVPRCENILSGSRRAGPRLMALAPTRG